MEPPDDLSDSEYLPAPHNRLSASEFSAQQPAQPAEPAKPPLKQSTLSFSRPPPCEYLAKLNPAQREAVTASAEGGLAIHAGPGSGKTAVLTTRVAYLVQTGGIKPEELVVVTFTNKAANEMKVRLSKIVGAETVDKLVMGTFHSVCGRADLRKYAKLVSLASNFLITDRDDCLGIIKRLLQALPVPANLKREMKPQTWLESISKCKSRMMSPSQYRADRSAAVDQDKVEWVAKMYEAYEDALAGSNALDFDDLLVRGYQLFRNHPRVIAKIKSVLIDEFQDTNLVQYDIVKLIAAPSGSLTVVGDPDQSIYGWRNAEVENLEKMLKGESILSARAAVEGD
ncbi:ATP-dependent DNA helicase [Rhodotorula toruloides]|uniref:ATP-dependent DNA helicase n=1 Tax=Rhodotorula toruloides TaxID=5286 RepID=A0A511KF09_RHOTO|nr:ATP-dependent DNA helicase [Rhodotorula toruloides]